MSPSPSHVAVLGTGGTIGNTTGGRVGIADVIADVAAGPHAEEARRAGLDPARLVVEEARRVAGSAIAPGDWVAIRARAQALLDRSDVSGLVVTHGTFTVEETSWFLHLTLRTTKPVVVTCAQRKHDLLGNDGDRNLLDAVAIVGAGATAGDGVVVTVAQEIHSARDVVKLSEHPGGFGSRDLGLLGTIDEGEIRTYRRVRRRHTVDSQFAALPVDVALPRVDVADTYAGADGVAIDAFVGAGAAGIVLNGFPYSGKPTVAQAEAIERAIAAGRPVVRSNRGGYGRVPSGADAPGVGADDLTAVKARILLMLAIAAGRTSTDDLERIFGEY